MFTLNFYTDIFNMWMFLTKKRFLDHLNGWPGVKTWSSMKKCLVLSKHAPSLPRNAVERRNFSGSDTLPACTIESMARNFYCSWRVPKTKVELFLLHVWQPAYRDCCAEIHWIMFTIKRMDINQWKCKTQWSDTKGPTDILWTSWQNVHCWTRNGKSVPGIKHRLTFARHKGCCPCKLNRKLFNTSTNW